MKILELRPSTYLRVTAYRTVSEDVRKSNLKNSLSNLRPSEDIDHGLDSTSEVIMETTDLDNVSISPSPITRVG